MRVLGLDIETTGLNFETDHITELAWVVKDVGAPKPLTVKSRFVRLPDGVKIPDVARELTKITDEHCAHGSPLVTHVNQLGADIRRFNVEYIVAHNGTNFDRPFLLAKLGEMADGCEVFSKPWLDTSVDCTYPPDCRHTTLMYVAAYFGFLNPFPHSAVFDVMTMLKVLDQFDARHVAARAALPWVVVRADVAYNQRDLAKARRYSWETIGAERYPKSWVKRVKECDLEKEQAEAPFGVVKIA